LRCEAAHVVGIAFVIGSSPLAADDHAFSFRAARAEG
jgi:hypothetical protein